MPWGRALFPWVSFDDPPLWQGDGVCERTALDSPRGLRWGLPGAHQDCSAPVPSGSLLHNARLSLHPGLCGMPPSAVGKALRLLGTQTKASWGLEVWQGVTWIRATFQKAPQHRKAGRDSRRRTREGRISERQLAFLNDRIGSCTWLPWNRVKDLLAMGGQTSCQNFHCEMRD